MSANELPALLVRMLALWNGGAIDPAGVYAVPPDDLVATVTRYRAAFPDLRWVVDEWVAAGDRYVLRMHATGTHTGDPFESEIGTAEATGESFTMRGIEVLEIRDDRIVDGWQVWDMGPLYAALGARVGPNASR